jgi:hypothetical protein
MTWAVPIAIVSGLYTCAWGAFKDGPFEGFRPHTFFRSMLFSVGIVVGLFAVPRLHADRLSPFQLFFVVMGVERLATEIYKGCLRAARDPARFAIPQQLMCFGRTIDRGGVREALGGAGLGGIALVLLVDAKIASMAAFIAVAATAGLVVAVGGAYKDAPFEGFQPLKFFRSPLVVTTIAPLVWRLGPQPLGLLLFMFGGIERLVVEYYKSYVVRSVPGKFRADLPTVRGPFLQHRHRLQYVATVIVVLLVVMYIAQ